MTLKNKKIISKMYTYKLSGNTNKFTITATGTKAEYGKYRIRYLKPGDKRNGTIDTLIQACQ